MFCRTAPSTLQTVTVMKRCSSNSASLTRPREISLLVSPGANVTVPLVVVSHCVSPSVEKPIADDTSRLPERTMWMTYAPAPSDTEIGGVVKLTNDSGRTKTGAEKIRFVNRCSPSRAVTVNQPRGKVWVTRGEPVTLTSGLPSPNDQVTTSLGVTGRSIGFTGEVHCRQGRASRSVAG